MDLFLPLLASHSLPPKTPFVVLVTCSALILETLIGSPQKSRCFPTWCIHMCCWSTDAPLTGQQKFKLNTFDFGDLNPFKSKVSIPVLQTKQSAKKVSEKCQKCQKSVKKVSTKCQKCQKSVTVY
eukprot:224309-Amphidinium_carterae.1